jgi:hypothetical protein
MRSLKPSKSTTTTWLIGSPVSRRTVARVSAGPPYWFAALIFEEPTPGMSTRRSRGMERYVSRCLPGSVRMSIRESERRALPRPGARPPSVPMRRVIVGFDRIEPFCAASWLRARR